MAKKERFKNGRIIATYTCTRGHEHETYAGTLRSLIASAKRGNMGAEVQRLVKAGQPFIICPQ